MTRKETRTNETAWRSQCVRDRAHNAHVASQAFAVQERARKVERLRAALEWAMLALIPCAIVCAASL